MSKIANSFRAWSVLIETPEIYVNFSIDFSNIYNDYLLANVIDSFLLLFW